MEGLRQVTGLFDSPPSAPQPPSGVNVLDRGNFPPVMRSAVWFTFCKLCCFFSLSHVNAASKDVSRIEPLKASEVVKALLDVGLNESNVH